MKPEYMIGCLKKGPMLKNSEIRVVLLEKVSIWNGGWFLIITNWNIIICKIV